MVAAPRSKPEPEPLLTAEEFFRLPESPEGGKMELADGIVVVMSPVGLQHGEVTRQILKALDHFAGRHGLGTVTPETGYRLKRRPDRVRAPDVSFLSEARRPQEKARRRSFVEGPPDLAVEVVSPDDKQADVLAKVGEYLDAGCPRVWVVQPKHEIVTVYRVDGTATTALGTEALTSDDAGFAVEGFALPVADIFGS